MTHLQEFVVSHAPGVAQEAARVAILEGEPFVPESQARYARHRRIALDRLPRHRTGSPSPSRPAPSTSSPGSTAWPTRSTSAAAGRARSGVGLAPGNAFGLGGEGHLRLCFAVDEPILIEALDRLEEGWAEYRKS